MSQENKENIEESDWLSPLPYESFEEKIQLNLKNNPGITLEELFMRLSIEQHDLQRLKIRIAIQEQNNNEMLFYLGNKIRNQNAISLVSNLKKAQGE